MRPWFTATSPPYTLIGPAAVMALPNVTLPVLVVLPKRTLDGEPEMLKAVASTAAVNALPTDSTTTAPDVTRLVLYEPLATKLALSAWMVMLDELAVDVPDNTVLPSEPK